MSWHWLAHVLGTDTQNSPFYDFLSGAGAAIPSWVSASSVVIGVTTFARRHNCHVRWCPRIGRHQAAGHLLCHRHHHTGALSAEQAKGVGR